MGVRVRGREQGRRIEWKVNVGKERLGTDRRPIREHGKGIGSW
jgi:hypothetical protein